MNSDIKLISLDLDGTLIKNSWEIFYSRVDEKIGKTEEIKSLVNKYNSGTLSEYEFMKKSYGLWHGVKKDIFLDIINDIELDGKFYNAINTLKDLNLDVAIVTGGFDLYVNHVTKDLEVDVYCGTKSNFVNGILFNIDITTKTELFERMVKDKGVSYNEVIHVDDGTNGIPLFKRCAYGIAVNTENINVIKNADIFLDDIEDLVPTIKHLNLKK
ncbi:MAG: HAD family hydrolase [Candidatus Hydrothermarchaeota archaeon]